VRTQSKVLRALQDGEIEPVGAGGSVHVDVRVLAATNKDLAREIEEGRFREDLYFRLKVIPIVVPPLRDRAEDVPYLIEYFAEQFRLENDLRAKKFGRKALEMLAGMPWRGNVRELRNVVERLLIMSPGETIEATDLPAELGLAPVDSAPLSGDAMRLDWRGVGLQAFKDAAEKAYLLNKLEEHDWNIAATAKAIETPRSNLYKKLDAYEIRKNRVATGDS
jgi:two-component system nitrogen regulation response regulator NtrX